MQAPLASTWWTPAGMATAGGYVMCGLDKQRMSVWSTPKNAGNHARQIRHFISHHSHPEEDCELDEQL